MVIRNGIARYRKKKSLPDKIEIGSDLVAVKAIGRKKVYPIGQQGPEQGQQPASFNKATAQERLDKEAAYPGRFVQQRPEEPYYRPAEPTIYQQCPRQGHDQQVPVRCYPGIPLRRETGGGHCLQVEGIGPVDVVPFQDKTIGVMEDKKDDRQ